MTDGQSLVDKKLRVRANFFVYDGIGRRGARADRDLKLEI